MKISEYQTPGGVLGYFEQNNEIVIDYYRGKDIELAVPSCIDAKRVVALQKKAFLSAKSLREVRLPAGLKRVGDFSFAYCSNLKSLYYPAEVETLGNGVFKECNALEQVIPIWQDEIEETDDESLMHVSYLLAATQGILESPYLFTPQTAGTPGWIEHLDQRIRQKLVQDDAEGFSKMLLCGEEDYVGSDSNYEIYCSNRRKEKIRLVCLRLLHPIGISTEQHKELSEYLYNHRKGAVNKQTIQEESWLVVLQEHGDEKEYYELLAANNCISLENLDAMLLDMGEVHAEMKAFLLRYRQEMLDTSDFFDDLEL